MFKKGTIILVPFPFTDLSKSKVRPALIISSQKISGNDVTVMFISSRESEKNVNTDYLINNKHKDFKATGLKCTSVFKTNKIATLDKGIILGELGILSKDLQNIINKKLKLVLDL